MILKNGGGNQNACRDRYRRSKCAVTIGNIKDEAVEMINKIKFKTSEYSNPYDLLNPQMIVIGSVYTRSSHLMQAEMNKVIESETLVVPRKNCIISKAVLGDSIGDYAAISAAYYGLSNKL